jgi:hypothetical protein
LIASETDAGSNTSEEDEPERAGLRAGVLRVGDVEEADHRVLQGVVGAVPNSRPLPDTWC